MKIYTMARYTGKTTKLIKMSAEKNYPIITRHQPSKKYILDKAKRMNLVIPEPISLDEFQNGSMRGKRLDYVAYLVDDLNLIAGDVFKDYFDKEVYAATMTVTTISGDYIDNNE